MHAHVPIRSHPNPLESLFLSFNELVLRFPLIEHLSIILRHLEPFLRSDQLNSSDLSLLGKRGVGIKHRSRRRLTVVE